MRGHRTWAVLLAAVAWPLILVGCSPGDQGGKKPASPSAPSMTTSSLPATVIGVSPGGVTTRVDAPAQSTEEEYFQACHAAKLWMDARGSTGEALIEPYLGMVQSSPSGVAGSWNIRWADLGAARQAGVIVATQAAARGECG